MYIYISICIYLYLYIYIYIYSRYTERRSASENCIIDNKHSIVFSF